MNMISHSWNEKMIDQLSEDTVIGGHAIPKGYCNATQLCKANGKWLKDYMRLKRSKAYLQELSLDRRIPLSNLVIEIKGKPDGDPSLQGTWVHPDVAISIAAWISPKFEVWANRTLRSVINGDFAPLTEEAKKQQAKLQELHRKIRGNGKISRRSLTDEIKHYIETHEVSDNYKNWIYSNCSDKINLAVFGKKAAGIRIERCQYTGLIRDTHEHPELKKLDRIEDFAARLISRGTEPFQAVSEAIEFYQ
jgi:hypothetical protein